jgi:thioredoxin 1
MLRHRNAFYVVKKPNRIVKTVVVLGLAIGLGALGCQKAEVPKGNEQPAAQKKLPRLLDLGAGKCIPCKMMAPILEELKAEYAGSLEVVFVDVWQNKQAANEYGIQSIPTQIFYDATGKELFRHEGFFAKEDILAKWKELGVDL